MVQPRAIFLLSRNFKNNDDESLTPINLPLSPIFRSDNKNLFEYLMKPAGFGIGSP